MPQELDAADAALGGRTAVRTPVRPCLREGVLELMLQAQSCEGLGEAALRENLRRLVSGTRDPAAALWAAYSGDRSVRTARLSRRAHGRVTIARA